jgi:hypothetical protein
MLGSKLFAAALLVSLAIAGNSSASTLFSDNFDTENGGVTALNYMNFANWTVTSGAVDLIGAGGPYDFIPGNGLYVDMDGSDHQAGSLVSGVFSLQPGKYWFNFDLAGNQNPNVPNDEPVMAKVDDAVSNVAIAGQTYLLPSNQGFTHESIVFTLLAPETVTLSFSEAYPMTGSSNVGMLLDNVSLSTPLPSSVWAGMALMAGLGVTRFVSARRVA